MPKTPTPTLVGSREVCDRLRIDRSTLSRWVALGVIPVAMRVSGAPNSAMLFDPADVDALAAERAS